MAHAIKDGESGQLAAVDDFGRLKVVSASSGEEHGISARDELAYFANTTAAADTLTMVAGTDTPVLDLDQTATSNGSKVTVDETGDGSATHCSVTVRLAQGDTDDLLGAYVCSIEVVDDSETAPADAIKMAEMGVLHFIATGGGDIGLT